MQSPVDACVFAGDVLADLIITHSPGFNIMTLLTYHGVFNHCFLKTSHHDRMTQDRWTVSLNHVFFQNQPTTNPLGFLAQIPTYPQLSCILWSTVSFLHSRLWIRSILSSMTTLDSFLSGSNHPWFLPFLNSLEALSKQSQPLSFQGSLRGKSSSSHYQVIPLCTNRVTWGPSLNDKHLLPSDLYSFCMYAEADISF